MDHFHEEVVKKHRRMVDEIAYYFSLLVMVLSGVFALMEISQLPRLIMSGQYTVGQLLPEILMTLLLAAIAVLVFFYRDRLRTEYEYTFTNGALDFAQVFNNKKRKSLGSLNVKTIDAFGPVAGGSFQRYISMQGVQQTRWFLNRDGNLYFFYFQKDSNKRVIVFEPSEELVGLIRQYIPFGAYQE